MIANKKLGERNSRTKRSRDLKPAPMMAAFLLIPLILISLPSFSLSSSHTITDAADTLSNSGYLSAALTLQLVSQTLFSRSPSATIFVPSDAAFIHSGQPSLKQLRYHISPLRFSVENLKSLPYGTAIPTLLFNRTLIVTSSHSSSQLSINGVKINERSIYDDDVSTIIYGTDNFFDFSFQIPAVEVPAASPSFISAENSAELSNMSDNNSNQIPPSPISFTEHNAGVDNFFTEISPSPSSFRDYSDGLEDSFNSSVQISPGLAPTLSPASILEQSAPNPSQRLDFYVRASHLLRSQGYTRMATFLEMQLVGSNDHTKLTIFAPVDIEIDEFVKSNFSDYAFVFRGHTVSEWLSWNDFLTLDDGTILETFLGGHEIKVTRSGDALEFNGVPVILPDMFFSEWLVVHGVRQSLVSHREQLQMHIGYSFSELDGEIYENPPGNGNEEGP